MLVRKKKIRKGYEIANIIINNYNIKQNYFREGRWPTLPCPTPHEKARDSPQG
jgi:hypothetical protein